MRAATMAAQASIRPLRDCVARRGSVWSSSSSSLAYMEAGPSSRRTFSNTAAAQAKPRKERQVQDPLALRNMPRFQFDDVPTLGHHILDRQRELLKYGRLVEWELPKLEALRKPYQPPDAQCILRFRSLHYQGEAHPATRKSVVTFSVADLFGSGVLTSSDARRKFLLLAGVRWDPFGKDVETSGAQTGRDTAQSKLDIFTDRAAIEERALNGGMGSIKISCERFPEERQNLKWCSDVIDKMVKEANSNASDVANIPLDLRAARAREAKRIGFARKQAPTIADFPKEWLA